MRIGSIVAVGIALAVVPSVAVSARGHDRTVLRTYLSRAGVQMTRYREAVRPLDQLGDPAYPDESVPALLSAASADVGALVKPWAKIKEPVGLHSVHTGRARSLHLFSQALGILGDGWAQFLVTQNPEDLQAARDLAAPLNTAASRLQRQWTKALRAALRRAGLRAPGWLRAQ
jgi:hypothetical protein